MCQDQCVVYSWGRQKITAANRHETGSAKGRSTEPKLMDLAFVHSRRHSKRRPSRHGTRISRPGKTLGRRFRESTPPATSGFTSSFMPRKPQGSFNLVLATPRPVSAAAPHRRGCHVRTLKPEPDTANELPPLRAAAVKAYDAALSEASSRCMNACGSGPKVPGAWASEPAFPPYSCQRADGGQQHGQRAEGVPPIVCASAPLGPAVQPAHAKGTRASEPYVLTPIRASAPGGESSALPRDVVSPEKRLEKATATERSRKRSERKGSHSGSNESAAPARAASPAPSTPAGTSEQLPHGVDILESARMRADAG
ncbi:hypothetical protein FB451DRAFT_1178232 [Mycena latifolia]|nr:hypothetical protein FB451DRAFT_1178232 [Mycena latifolia]